MLKFSIKFLPFFLILLMIGCSNLSSKKMTANKEIDRKNMDTTVSPRADFYDYAVGNWIKNNKIPDAYPGWNTFYQLNDNNYDALKKILTKAENDKNAAKGSIEQKVGDFYYSGMDTVKIEKDGYNPIKSELSNIDNMKTKDDFYKELTVLHLGYSNPLFSFSSGADAKNSDLEIAQLDQSGLGLPDRDYYLKNDARSKKIREQYVNHVEKMFKLIGENDTQAKANANTVMNIETKLAKASYPRVELRNPKKIYNKMPLKKLVKLSPDFDWNVYFTEMGVKNPGDINVAEPPFIKEVSSIVKTTPIADWKAYFKWNVLRRSANYLSKDFVNEHFNFYGSTLYGMKTMQPRWKRVLGTINGNIGQLLGKLYVKENFPPEAKAKALKIVHNLINKFGERIKNLDWMSEATKKKALYKLHAITIKIGYPDKWKDYSGLAINRESFFGNVLNSTIFSTKKNLAKIGKAVDKTEWLMNPQTVNAYYNPPNNEIVFPAGILQPPFFDPNADDAVNYGAMGCVIGHEMTHGFDDEGRQYDAKGNMEDWWTKQDEEKFDKRAKKIVEQFDAYNPIDTLHINGKLTEGENIADLGGINISFDAFKDTKEYKEGKKIDGFTPAQRFFLSFANVWKNKTREQTQMIRLKTDPHSPAKYRVIGPLSNFPAFWKAFNVKPGDKMERPADKLVKIW